MKGQRLRFFMDGVPFAGETSCELHISIETEESVNKDTADNFAYPEMVGYIYDASIECQVEHFGHDNNFFVGADYLTPGETAALQLKRTAENSMSQSTVIASGNFIPTSVSYKADNKKTVTASIKLEGTGVLTL